MHILALDYGTKTIGLAWTDTTLGAVLPYGVLEGRSVLEKVRRITTLVAGDRIERIVVGYPLGLKGEETAATERVKKFVFELQKATQVPIIYHDERFSSYGADSMGGTVSRDERAAMFILEGYVKSLKI